MKLPKNVRPTPIEAACPAIDTVLVCHEPGAIDAMRDVIRQNHDRLSRSAVELRSDAGQPGVMSLLVGGGSRPGMSDATFVGRSDYFEAESEQEKAHNARMIEAIDATPAGEFLLILVVGKGFGMFRINHFEGPTSESPLEKPYAGSAFLTQSRESEA